MWRRSIVIGVREMHLHVLASFPFLSFVFFIPLVASTLASPPVRSVIAGRVTTLPPSLANFLSFYCERRRWMGMDGRGGEGTGERNLIQHMRKTWVQPMEGTYSSAEHNVSSTSHMRLLPSFASHCDVSIENTIAQTNAEKIMLSSIIC